jgi:hypothetical protein
VVKPGLALRVRQVQAMLRLHLLRLRARLHQADPIGEVGESALQLLDTLSGSTGTVATDADADADADLSDPLSATGASPSLAGTSGAAASAQDLDLADPDSSSASSAASLPVLERDHDRDHENDIERERSDPTASDSGDDSVGAPAASAEAAAASDSVLAPAASSRVGAGAGSALADEPALSQKGDPDSMVMFQPHSAGDGLMFSMPLESDDALGLGMAHLRDSAASKSAPAPTSAMPLLNGDSALADSAFSPSLAAQLSSEFTTPQHPSDMPDSTAF